MPETLLIEDLGAVRRITLNRPERLNALSGLLLHELDDAFHDAEQPSVRAVILTGAGRAFSAGADLREANPAADIEAALRDTYNPLVQRMRALGKPVVAAVNGICAGAAANIALACDILLAARSAVFIEVFARIGLMPDAGGTYFLPRSVGTHRALAASLLAEDVSAQRAHEWGMVWQVVEDEALAESALALAERLARGPTRAYQAIKQAVYASESNGLAAQLALEARLQGALSRTTDFIEGVSAFVGKRQAEFRGE